MMRPLYHPEQRQSPEVSQTLGFLNEQSSYDFVSFIKLVVDSVFKGPAQAELVVIVLIGEALLMCSHAV